MSATLTLNYRVECNSGSVPLKPLYRTKPDEAAPIRDPKSDKSGSGAAEASRVPPARCKMVELDCDAPDGGGAAPGIWPTHVSGAVAHSIEIHPGVSIQMKGCNQAGAERPLQGVKWYRPFLPLEAVDKAAPRGLGYKPSFPQSERSLLLKRRFCFPVLL